jgi:hypothetical protein
MNMTTRTFSRKYLGAALGLLMAAGAAQSAWAQSSEGSAFYAGPIGWTPTVSFKDVGIDSNIFDSHTDVRSDFTATFTPQVTAVYDSSRMKLQSTGIADVVYFERYTNERSLNRQVTGRLEVPLDRFVPFAAGSYINTRERQNAELDMRARRREIGGSVGASVPFATRGTLIVATALQNAAYSEAQSIRGLELAEQLNRNSASFTAGVRYTLTPLTTFVADAQVASEDYEFAIIKDQRRTHVSAGFEFAPDAVIRGRATFGYHALSVSDPTSVPFGGFTADVDLGYVLLGVTRFDLRFSRDTTYSVESPYYLRTFVGLNVLQTFIGPVDLVGRVGLERMNYPGIPALNVQPRTDDSDIFGGGVVVRLTRTTRLTINYDTTTRRSPLESLGFDRQRLFTSIIVGFK